MHYENGQIIYYLLIDKFGYTRVLQLQIQLNEEKPQYHKGIILNPNWDSRKNGEFFYLKDLMQHYIGDTPIEPIAELYRRKVEEVNKEIAPLMTKTMNEYYIPSNAKHTTKNTD